MDAVVFLAPYFQTTKGHRNVKNVIQATIAEIIEERELDASFVVVTQRGFLREHMIEGLKPALMIVDFPDSGEREWLRAMQSIDRFKTCKLVALRMCTPGWDMDPNPAPIYDAQIVLEPGAELIAGERVSNGINVRPMVNSTALKPLTDEDRAKWKERCRGVNEPVLVVLSGLPEEKHLLMKLAAQKYGRHRIIPSSDFDWPAIRFASLATRVFSPTGYSTTWELIALGCERKVDWIVMDRPSEDCKGRIERVQRNQLQGQNWTNTYSKMPPLKDALADILSETLRKKE